MGFCIPILTNTCIRCASTCSRIGSWGELWGLWRDAEALSSRGIIPSSLPVYPARCPEGDALMYTTLLLAAALQQWERYSAHALAVREVAATLAKGTFHP